MSKILIALTFLFVSASTAFGASNNFLFFGKLGMLIALNVLLGGILTLFAIALASTLFDKMRQGLLRPVRVRAVREERRGSRAPYLKEIA